MTDHFAVLGEIRRPWIDPENLKQKFLSLSAEAHPDRAHTSSAEEKQRVQQCYTELNAAYQCLRDPKHRLQHLLELERGLKPGLVQQVPSELMNLSLEVGQACRNADTLLAEKSKTTSPLLQLQIFERAQEEMEKLGRVQHELEVRQGAIVEEVRMLDTGWGETGGEERSVRLARLEALYPLLSYYERWIGQVRERTVQLVL